MDKVRAVRDDTSTADAPTSTKLTDAFFTSFRLYFMARLQKSYGVGGTALAWISSVIQGRQQSVTFNGYQSALKYGVLQGSVLGPLLFILYTTSDVISIAASLGVGAHSYADDSQLYLHCLQPSTNRLPLSDWLNASKESRDG